MHIIFPVSSLSLALAYYSSINENNTGNYLKQLCDEVGTSQKNVPRVA
jgi:hypothetical protein